ncbi:MAG: sensor histidine kinase [Campylobacterales bacterium]|nr:sensor histidine kinase [Campylobacterales bacterium]
MYSVELKITLKDWIYITIIGAFFGLFISLFFYYLNPFLHHYSTILFSTVTAVVISLLASILISVSNNVILPKVQKRFWYLISFFFSFLSGFLGFLISFFLFQTKGYSIVQLLDPYWLHIALTIGFLTFLIGLILHQFISMKYKNESIKNEMLLNQIKALENELNPHFLFNALNSVSELIYVDQKKAERAVLDLSRFLRNALNQKESLVSISEELEMVKTYLEIENIRFNNKINLHMNNNSNLNLNKTKIPKFSIQLLIENGIKHGFTGKPLDFELQFTSNCISICNNGSIPKNVQFGTGLSNLQSRLKLLNVGTLEFQINNKVQFNINLQGTKSENTNRR